MMTLARMARSRAMVDQSGGKMLRCLTEHFDSPRTSHGVILRNLATKNLLWYFPTWRMKKQILRGWLRMTSIKLPYEIWQRHRKFTFACISPMGKSVSLRRLVPAARPPVFGLGSEYRRKDCLRLVLWR